MYQKKSIFLIEPFLELLVTITFPHCLKPFSQIRFFDPWRCGISWRWPFETSQVGNHYWTFPFLKGRTLAWLNLQNQEVSRVSLCLWRLLHNSRSPLTEWPSYLGISLRNTCTTLFNLKTIWLASLLYILPDSVQKSNGSHAYRHG